MNSRGQTPPRLVPLGRVAGVHGLKGGVRIAPLAGGEPPLPETFTLLKEILVGGRPFEVLRASQGRRHVVLHLAGIRDRAQAEAIVGLEVAGEAHRFPPLPEGEYYHHELLGLNAYSPQGVLLGTLVEILETGSKDVYVFRNEETHQELMIPAVDEFILEIRIKERKIIVSPPEWL